jgi:diacylglycerol O-acyltransferase
MTRLSTIDGGFLLTESQHSPKHVGGLQVFRLPPGKGPAWLRKLLDTMRQVPPGYPFNQRIRGRAGLLYELEPDPGFEMNYHVRHTVLPRPGNDEQLAEVLSRMHANLLDRERPLWEFHLIEGLSDRRFAFYLKIHHALADGITIGRWYDDSGSASAADTSVRPVWARPAEPSGPPPQPFDPVRLILDGLKFVGDGVRTATGLSLLTARLVQRRFFEGDGNIALPLSAPRTPLNVTPGAARKISFTHYRLGDLRAIGKALDGSINDVVMTMCDMALRRYFDEHGEAPDGPLVAYMPVNIRTEEEDGEGNLVTLLQVKLADDHDDPAVALEEVRESIASAREVYSGASRQAVQYYALVVALLSLFEEVLRLDKIMRPVENLVISNVPGARETAYFAGAEQVAIYPVSTLPPMTALNVTACSYAGTMYFGLIGGRTVIPDLHRLTDFLDAAFTDLAEAAGFEAEARPQDRSKARRP